MSRLVNGLVLGLLLGLTATAFGQSSNGTVNAKQTGTWTVQPGNTPNTTPWLTKPHDGTNAATIKAASTAAVSTDTALVVTQRPIADPVCTSTVAISQTATTKLVTGVSGQRIYICALAIVANAAEVVSLTEGTGTTCGTSETALYGSTTAANGMSFAANGGIAQSSYRPFMKTQVNANDLCLKQSGSSRVTGSVSYVIQ